MKTPFCSIALLFTYFSAQAQLTLTAADMPLLGDTFVMGFTMNPAGNNPETTGPAYNWNYSTLQKDTQEVWKFVPVSTTPLAYQFYFNNNIFYPSHKASYAQPVYPPETSQTFITFEDVYNFYKSDVTAWQHVGFGAKMNGDPISVRYIPIDTIYRFPLSFGNIDSCYSEYGFTVPGYGYFGERKKRVNVVDGYGQLQTPLGTFEVLRIKSRLFIRDTVYNASFGFGFLTPERKQIEYKWMGIGSGVPLLQINANANQPTPVITAIYYRDTIANTAIRQIFDNEPLTTFPNPSSGDFFFHFNLHGEITIYDACGKLIYRTNFVPPRQIISLPRPIPGLYLLRHTDSYGNNHLAKLIIR